MKRSFTGKRKPSELRRAGRLQSGKLRSERPARSSLSFQGKPIDFKLTDTWGYPIPEEELYRPYFGAQCSPCGMKLVCNGCSQCGKCG